MTRKIANDGNPIDISERMDDLRELFASDPRIVAVYIYGSYGSPHQTPLSDVDLAVLFRRESVPPLEDELRLTASVIDTVGVEDVSVCVLNRLPIVSQFKIVAEGRLIFLSDAEAHLGFVEYVFKVYGDYDRGTAASSRSTIKLSWRRMSMNSKKSVDLDKIRVKLQRTAR